MSPSHFWTLERARLLVELCATERWTRDIADKLGVTRNAVIGKVHRMREKGHEIKLKGTPGRTAKAGTVARRARKARPNCDIPASRPALPPPARDENGNRLEPRLSMRRLSLLELEGTSCRWPIGEPGKPGFCFCGNDTHSPERVYCAPHHAFAHHG